MKIRMYSLTAAMEKLGVSLEERADVTAIALARAMGYKLPIPAEAVSNPSQYFETHYRQDCERSLSEVNERVVINLTDVSNLVASIWLARYRLVHEPFNQGARDYIDQMAAVGADKFPSQVSNYLVRSSDVGVLDGVVRAMDSSMVPPAAAPTEGELQEASDSLEVAAALSEDVSVSTEGLFDFLSKEKRIGSMIAGREWGKKWAEENVFAPHARVVRELKAKIRDADTPKQKAKLEKRLKAIQDEHDAFKIAVEEDEKDLVRLRAKLKEIQDKKAAAAKEA